MTTETVTISRKQYNELMKSQEILDALYAGGVDNWEGYDYSLEDVVLGDDEDDEE